MSDDDALRKVLADALEWLYRTEQPDGAIIDQFGIRSPRTGNRYYSLYTAGYNGAAIVVVTVAEPHYKGEGDNRTLTNPLAENEVEHVALRIERLGYPYYDTWGGTAETGSVGLMLMVHPSLEAAHARYREGCPDHGTVLCTRNQGCQWYSRGRAQVQVPAGWT